MSLTLTTFILARRCCDRPHALGVSGFGRARVLYMIFLALGSVAISYNTQAQEQSEWSISGVFGAHHPKLKALNEGLYRAPILGSGTIGINDDKQTVTFAFDPSLPEVGNGSKAGFEFQWRPNKRHSLIFSLSSWEQSASATFSGEVPSQTFIVKFDGQRRTRLSYTEYAIGWRMFLFNTSKFNLYSRVSTNELFDVDYREDFVFAYSDNPELDGVKRVVVTEAQTSSLFAIQLALGGEWYLRSWFSIAFEGGYLNGLTQSHLRHLRRRTDFSPFSDRVVITYPSALLSDGTIGYLPPGTTNNQWADGDVDYQPLTLDFDGWQVVFRINVYI